MTINANEETNVGNLIPFSDDEEARVAPEGEEDPDEPGLTEDVRKTRRQKRGERIAAQLREGREAKEEAKELRERLARLEGAHLQLSQQTQANRPPPVDPYEQKLQELERERDRELAAADAEIKSGKYTQERADYYKRRGDEIDRERIRTIYQQENAAQAPRIQAAVQTTVAANQWQMLYPDVHSNQRALAWAQSKHQMELAEGKAPSTELIHQVYKETQERFGMVKKAPPTKSERSKFSGSPSHGSSTEAGPARSKDGIVMTRELSRLARARYPKMKPEEADKLWAQTTGKKMRERGEL